MRITKKLYEHSELFAMPCDNKHIMVADYIDELLSDISDHYGYGWFEINDNVWEVEDYNHKSNCIYFRLAIQDKSDSLSKYEILSRLADSLDAVNELDRDDSYIYEEAEDLENDRIRISFWKPKELI